tara:strand:- start:405 stop:1652 length:1248 start_codon:yes stop_codon:yes gene_type:complete
VFIEGLEEPYNPETGEGINPECLDISVSGKCDPNEKLISCMNTKLGKAGQKRGVPSCGVDRDGCKGPTQIWCGNDWGKTPGQSPRQSPGQSPRQSPNPSQTPPPKDITEDEKKLKGFFAAAEYTSKSAREYLGAAWEVTEISFHFDGMAQLQDFLSLLDRNTNNSVVDLPHGYPPILDVDYTVPWGDGPVTNTLSLDISYIFKVANCFKDDIIGLIGRGHEGVLTKDSLSLLPKLKYLDLANTSVSGNLSSLKDLTKLEYLDLMDTGVSGKLSDLQDLTKLKHLDLNLTSVSGKLSDINGLTNLESLDLAGSGVSGKLSDLQDFTNLEFLDLRDTGFSGKLSDLQDLTNLKYIYLCPNSSITGDLSDVSTIKNAYDRENTDFNECSRLTGVIQDINCSSERYNCMCGDSLVTCDN